MNEIAGTGLGVADSRTVATCVRDRSAAVDTIAGFETGLETGEVDWTWTCRVVVEAAHDGVVHAVVVSPNCVVGAWTDGWCRNSGSRLCGRRRRSRGQRTSVRVWHRATYAGGSHAHGYCVGAG